MRKVQVESDKTLERDMESNAILLKDVSLIESYQQQKSRLLAEKNAQQNVINTLETRLAALENLVNRLIQEK